MAGMEVESPVLFGTCVVAGTLILSCKAYLVWGPHGAVVVVVLIGFFFSTLRYRMVRKVDGMESFAKRFEQSVEGLTHGLRDDALGPKSRAAATVLRQSSSKLAALMAEAHALKDDFERVVIEPLSQFGSTKCGLKSAERAAEKAWLEYAGDCGRLSDLLRGCVICPSDEGQMVHIISCCDYLRRLELNSEIKIMCELQILDQNIYDLNTVQTPVYELCRSCKLVGPPPQASRRSLLASSPKAASDLPLVERLCLGFLRFLVGLFGAKMATVCGR
jgi:hypothetical protein